MRPATGGTHNEVMWWRRTDLGHPGSSDRAAVAKLTDAVQGATQHKVELARMDQGCTAEDVADAAKANEINS